MLQDKGQVDCPLLERMGYPIILVHTTPGQKCTPEVQMVAISRNPQNNRFATTAAARINAGLALGCVVGDVHAMRRDGRPFTSKEWWVLWDILMTLKDEYGEGPGHVDDELLTEYKQRTRGRMKRQGLKKHGTGSGICCMQCGEEEADDCKMMRCSRCMGAYYCSRECQKAHWRAGHKAACKSVEENSVPSKEQQLLSTAVLRPEQIMQHNAPVPPMPRGVLTQQLPASMPEDLHRLFVYNRNSKKERICPGCRTKYKLLPNPPKGDRASKEQEMSGICSYACFKQLSPYGPYSGPDWYGQSAEIPQGVKIKF